MHDAYAGVTAADLRAEEAIHRIERLERVAQFLADETGIDLESLWNPPRPLSTRTIDQEIADGAHAMAETFRNAFLPEDMRPPKKVTIHQSSGYGYNKRSLPPSRWIYEYGDKKMTIHDDGQEAVDALYAERERDYLSWAMQV